MKLSKIDVAEAQIRAAVRMFFEGQHPVPIFTLANAAREIVASIGEQTDVQTVQSDLAEQRGVPFKKFVQPLSRIANFFKHADRDADAYLEFNEDDLEVVLQLACHDFGRVTGRHADRGSDLRGMGDNYSLPFYFEGASPKAETAEKGNSIFSWDSICGPRRPKAHWLEGAQSGDD